MFSILLWFVIMSSGGVLCAAVWERKYEDLLPVTCSIIILLLFVCGIGGSLETGVIIICIFGVVIYGFVGVYLFWKKSYKRFFKNLFTPGFALFSFFLLAACFLNLGKMAENWDEFSHWVDIVKVMTMFDDFGTYSGANSLFSHYPPGMTLFQYFLQKLYLWTGGACLSEWRAYVAYQMFLLSFLFPCVKFNWKRPALIVFSGVVIFLCPLLFYTEFYISVYIDAGLGLLLGAGFVTVYFNRNRDLYYSLRVLLTCAMLVLLKDAGMLFAVMLATVYVADMLWNYSDCANARKKYLCVPVSVLAVLLPKCLWSFHLYTRNVESRSSLNPVMLFDVLMGRDNSYRKTVLENYYKEFLTRAVKLGNIGISFNYLFVGILILALICILICYYEKRDNFMSKKGKTLLVGMSVQFFLYIVGLCATYMSNFGEYEATRLASFERYINIVYLSGWTVVLFLAFQVFQSATDRTSYKQVIIFCCVGILIAPMENVYRYLSHSTVRHSMSVRLRYDALTTEIMNITPQGSKVYLISQESQGFDYWVLRFNIRPNSVNDSGWSIGEAFYEGDIWTEKRTSQGWKEELLNGGYDYVALYKINDYFLNNFSCLFQTPETIEPNSLYRINKEIGLLEKCGGNR